MTQNLACIILAAGQGSRMKSALPKPMHQLAGRSMVQHVIANAAKLQPKHIITVIGASMPEMVNEVAPHPTVIQQVANGTGGAVMPAEELLKDFDGDVLVLYGDTPLVSQETLQAMVDKRREDPQNGVVYSAMKLDDPKTYGRMVLNADQTLARIVEFKDADDAQKQINICNGGIVCADGRHVFKWLAQLDNNNAQGEYYLTDLPQIALKDGFKTQIVTVAEAEMAGANSRKDLSELETIMQNKMRDAAMAGGATLIDPSSVFFCYDTKIGQDVVIEPNVVFGPKVIIDNNVTIKAFSHLEGAHVKSGASIGPYARLRPGTEIGENAKIGNFVEIKKTKIGTGSKASHLTYLGDAVIGSDVNIGAGTITCNYDGYLKYQTTIEDGAFVGSNSALVAPVTIGQGAIIGAGSTISKDAPADALTVTRAKQQALKDWAAKFRKVKAKEKEAKKAAALKKSA